MCLQSNTHKTFLLGSDELYFCPAAHVAPWGSLSWRRCRSWRPVRWTQGQLYSGTPAAAGTPSVLKSIIFSICVIDQFFLWIFVDFHFRFSFLFIMIYTRIISYHIHSSTLCTCADSVFNRYELLLIQRCCWNIFHQRVNYKTQPSATALRATTSIINIQ